MDRFIKIAALGIVAAVTVFSFAGSTAEESTYLLGAGGVSVGFAAAGMGLRYFGRHDKPTDMSI